MTDRSTLFSIAALGVGKIGPLFLAALHRLYAAHAEKVQMRFAPQPIPCDRGIKNRSYFG
jgi:hypothetical protein